MEKSLGVWKSEDALLEHIRKRRAITARAFNSFRNNIIKVAIINGYDVQLPQKATDGSAGYDFYMPKLTEVFLNTIKDNNKELDTYEENGIYLKAHKKILIPSGLKIKIPQNTAFVAFEKSGLATKNGIRPTCKVIDSDYQGQVFVGLENTNNEDYFITCDSKIGQYLLLPVIQSTIEQVKIDNLYEAPTKRGNGGFGSTNRKGE